MANNENDIDKKDAAISNLQAEIEAEWGDMSAKCNRIKDDDKDKELCSCFLGAAKPQVKKEK